jgi:2-alkenal reductase
MQRKPITRSLTALLLCASVLLSACDDPFANSRTSATTTPGASATTTAQSLSRTSQQTQATATAKPSGGQNNQGLSQNNNGNNPTYVYPDQQIVVQVVQRTHPAVVTVVNRLESQSGGYAGEALGSGFVVDDQGHIYTNNHVIEGSSEGGLSVIFSNGDQVQADLVGTDPVSDLAVLKVDHAITTTLALGSSDNLQVGETVIAIGSALGDFKNTVTVGVISGLNRVLPEAGGTEFGGWIQTDAAINHGNSGGPLIDLNGQAIGINTAVIRGTGDTGTGTGTGIGDVAEGLGFAIPIDTVKRITTQLINEGSVARPYLGVTSRPLSRQIASYYDLRDENGNLLENGALVVDVQPRSAADQAGLQSGDVITSINGNDITEENVLSSVLWQFKPGDTVTLSVVREGQRQDVEVQLGTRPAQP